MVADGIPQNLKCKESFRDYTKRLQPRIVHPHHITIHRIAECIELLQGEMQVAELLEFIKGFGGEFCVGLQLDLWTDANTHVCYAALSLSRCVERMSGTKVVGLEVSSEVLEFEQFPETRHTANNIKTWIQSVLTRNKLPYHAVSGVSPDGAADGVAAIKQINELHNVLDKCQLHQLNRTVLASLGLALTPCPNEGAKEVVRSHRRISQLSNQSRHVFDAIRKLQIKANVKEHHILTTTDTCPTRWGNQFDQFEKNIVLRPVLDPVITKHKSDNRNQAVGMLEDVFDDGGKKTTNEVNMGDLGILDKHWDDTIELEAFLRQPYMINKTIEHQSIGHKKPITGAQGIQMISQWSKNMYGPLKLLDFPKSAKLKHRTRLQLPARDRSILSEATQTAQAVAWDQLEDRFFTNAPSRSRLIQLYMSKNMPISEAVPKEFVSTANGYYLVALRAAARHLNKLSASENPEKKMSLSASTTNCKGKRKRHGMEQSAVVMLISPPVAANSSISANDDAPDAVMAEVNAWDNLPMQLVEEHRDPSTGLVDEFALLFARRHQFPLHYFVFRQCASHLGHEANVEQLFSGAKHLSDPNMLPSFLRNLTKISANKSKYKPSEEQIWSMYQSKYSGLRNYENNDDNSDSSFGSSTSDSSDSD